MNKTIKEMQEKTEKIIKEKRSKMNPHELAIDDSIQDVIMFGKAIILVSIDDNLGLVLKHVPISEIMSESNGWDSLKVKPVYPVDIGELMAKKIGEKNDL